MSFKATVSLAVDASHQLDLPYESKCNNLHGHRYNIEVDLSLRADPKGDLTHPLDTLNPYGMIADFVHVKKAIKDVLDHRSVQEAMSVYLPGAQTTAENICLLVLKVLRILFANPKSFIHPLPKECNTMYRNVGVDAIRIWETPGNVVEWRDDF